MVEEGRLRPEVLAQIAAVCADLGRPAKLLLADHVESCPRGAAINGAADDWWASLEEALDGFIR